MGRRSRFSPEVREQAVGRVNESRAKHRSEQAVICSAAGKPGCGPKTLRKWIRRAETEAG